MLKRNILYTAITRAKIEVNLVSNPEAITKAIQNEDTSKRITLLTKKIVQLYQKEIGQNPFLKQTA